MDASNFALPLILYIVAMVAGITAAFFAKLISPLFIKIIIGLHLVLFIGWLLTCSEFLLQGFHLYSGYFFLTYFCTGVFGAGIILRSHFNKLLMLYFSLFLFSIIFFILTPARFLGFISSGNFHYREPERMHLKENYFLIEQGSNTFPGMKFFKLVRENGMFHKTLARDIKIPAITDSVVLDNMNSDGLYSLKIYFKTNGNADSSIMEVNTVINNENEIKQIRNH